MLFLIGLLLLGAAYAKNDTNFVDSIGRGISKEVSAVKQPFEAAIVATVSTQCDNLKKLVGITYDQLEETEMEPDVSKLSLVYRDETVRVIFNISTAAQSILLSPDYRRHAKLFIFVHGFTDDPSKDAFVTISDALLQLGETNVLALDASPLIKWLYLRSTTYVQYIGERLGALLAALVGDGINPASIHIIGHSLGAHISSFAGKTFNNLTGQSIGRISGLDPAGPCFSNVEPELRLKATDAAFVDVMHTDAGVFGLKEPLGHVDFYPNGGKEQPNCLFQSCSHSRAWYYYAESVTQPQGFPATTCPSWGEFKKRNCTYTDVVYMGYPTPSDARGRYYLQTRGDEPYALGDPGIHFKDNQAVVKKIGESAKNVVTKLFG